MAIRETDHPDLYSDIQERNLLRQYDLLADCIQIGLQKGIESFDKYMLWELNHVAVANISQQGGRFRKEPVIVGNHTPPHFEKVPDLMDQFFSVIHESWSSESQPLTHWPAYALWRINWIHPFIEGNGRTARAACYFLLCMAVGRFLPGDKVVPERIRENPQPYYDALKKADQAWEQGHYDVSDLTRYLRRLLFQQLSEALSPRHSS